MLRHCLIHPVAPLLSLLAPLLRPFFSPVGSVPDAANLLFKPLKSYGFCAVFRPRAGRKGVFSPVISGKTGGATPRCRRECDGNQDCEKGRVSQGPTRSRKCGALQVKEEAVRQAATNAMPNGDPAPVVGTVV
jgi:hypothetical protein